MITENLVLCFVYNPVSLWRN